MFFHSYVKFLGNLVFLSKTLLSSTKMVIFQKIVCTAIVTVVFYGIMLYWKPKHEENKGNKFMRLVCTKCTKKCIHYRKISSLIKNAKESIDICAGEIASPTIIGALIEIHNKGLRVRVLVDREMYPRWPLLSGELQKAGIQVVEYSGEHVPYNFTLLDYYSQDGVLLVYSSNMALKNDCIRDVFVKKDNESITNASNQFERLWNNFTNNSMCAIL